MAPAIVEHPYESDILAPKSMAAMQRALRARFREVLAENRHLVSIVNSQIKQAELAVIKFGTDCEVPSRSSSFNLVMDRIDVCHDCCSQLIVLAEQLFDRESLDSQCQYPQVSKYSSRSDIQHQQVSKCNSTPKFRKNVRHRIRQRASEPQINSSSTCVTSSSSGESNTNNTDRRLDYLEKRVDSIVSDTFKDFKSPISVRSINESQCESNMRYTKQDTKTFNCNIITKKDSSVQCDEPNGTYNTQEITKQQDTNSFVQASMQSFSSTADGFYSLNDKPRLTTDNEKPHFHPETIDSSLVHDLLKTLKTHYETINHVQHGLGSLVTNGNDCSRGDNAEAKGNLLLSGKY